MTKLSWNETGSRIFEYGVEQAVLFPQDGPAIPWYGVVSIQEKISDSDARPFYLDGIKYRNDSGNEDFSAILEAYTYPVEFEIFDGTLEIADGVNTHQQERSPFNFVYKTLLGNDVDGLSLGYRIHILYNVTASPSQRAYKTLGTSLEPITFSWDLSTKPTIIDGYQPTAHLIIDSINTEAHLLEVLNVMLFGSSATDPTLLDGQSLANFVDGYRVLEITDNGDGTWTATGPDDVIFWLSETQFLIDWPSATYISSDTYVIGTL